MSGIATSTLLYSVAAFLFTSAFLVLFKPIAKLIGLLDHPGGRKQHQGAIPLVGGPAMLIGLLPPLLAITGNAKYAVALAISAVILVAVGMVDDYKDMQPRVKMLCQIVCALIVAWYGETQLHSFGDLLSTGDINLGMFSLPVTVIAIVGVINALNMSDGVDGLGGGITLISSMALAILAIVRGAPHGTELTLPLAAIVSAFLIFNFPLPNGRKASIFMGDSGSMLLGILVASFFIQYSQGAHRFVRPSTCLWLFAHPLFDTIGVMMWRILKGRSPFSAGREHLHHIIQHAGFKSSQCTYVILALSTFFAVAGIAFELTQTRESIVLALFICFFIAHFWVLKRAWKVTRFIKGARSQVADALTSKPTSTEIDAPAITVEPPNIPPDKDKRFPNHAAL